MKDGTLTRSSRFRVDYESRRSIALIILAGELDASTAPHLLSVIDRQLRSGPRVLVLDVQSITRVEPVGAAALAEAARITRARGVLFRLTNLTEHVQRMIDLARMQTECDFRPRQPGVWGADDGLAQDEAA